MPTPPKGPRLGGSPAHERLILANLSQSLFEHGKITTTLAKAKRLRPVAEKLITSAKRGSLHARRSVMKTLTDKEVVHKLFAEIGPSFATREGGYTRITKLMPRKGDNAPMAQIELIDEETVSASASRVARAAASRKKAEQETATTPAPEAAADADGTTEDAAETAPDAVEAPEATEESTEAEATEASEATDESTEPVADATDDAAAEAANEAADSDDK